LVVIINSAHASAKSGGGSVFASGGTTANLIPKENGSGALIDSLLSDSGTALTYNAKAVPSFTTGGATTNTIPKTSGTGGLIADSSITDDAAKVTTALPLNLTQAASTTNAIVQFNSVATTGLMFGASTQVGLKVSSAAWFAVDSNQNNTASIPSSGLFCWSSSTTYGGAVCDTALRRVAAASVGQGGANTASPIAQTFTLGESSRGGTDSNVAGRVGNS
jgi:hypothetical protein